MTATNSSWEQVRGQTWEVPSRFGFPISAVMASSVGSPFMTGFSLTSAVFILALNDQAMPLRNWSIMLFVAAALLFVMGVHATYWARLYISTPKKILEWWPQGGVETRHWPYLIAEQKTHWRGFEKWICRARYTYNIAILAMFSALAVAAVPATDSAVRWLTAGFIGLAGIIELAMAG